MQMLEWSASPRLAVALLAALVLALQPSGAEASTVSRSDPRGDAPAKIDILGARLTNGPARITGRSRIDSLTQIGRAYLVIGPPTDSDEAYVARVHLRRDGSLVKRFFYSSVVDDEPAPCRFRASWRPKVNVVTISVPHRCVPYRAAIYANVQMESGRNSDYGNRPARHLRRG